MPTVPCVEPLEYRKRRERNCPSLGHAVFSTQGRSIKNLVKRTFSIKILPKKKKCAEHHRNRHKEHPLYHELVHEVLLGVFEVAGQQPLFFWFHCERHVEKTVCHKIEPDNLAWQQRERVAQKQRARDRQHFPNASREQI